MDQLVLECNDLKAVFEPLKGMNLSSFKKGNIEMIHESKGYLIGPHYGERSKHMHNNSPHDPFFHGISRYAPWKAEQKGNQVTSTLEGKEIWEEKPLSFYQGQAFKIKMIAELDERALSINLSIVSETDSLIGIDYHLNASKNSVVRANSKMGEEIFSLEENSECTSFPFPNPLEGTIVLNTPDYGLKIEYYSPSQENCWRLICHKENGYVQIQPISSQDPYHPNLTVSLLALSLIPL